MCICAAVNTPFTPNVVEGIDKRITLTLTPEKTVDHIVIDEEPTISITHNPKISQ